MAALARYEGGSPSMRSPLDRWREAALASDASGAPRCVVAPAAPTG